MHILKYISRLLMCIVCVFSLCFASFAESNIYGDVGEYGDWLTTDNIDKYKTEISGDMEKFQHSFQNKSLSTDSVPVEAKIGLSFMKALSSIDYVLQISLVRFAIMFLFIMYAFWVALEAYKLIRDTGDYKTVVYNIFKKGIIIAVWVIILNYGPAKIFTMIMNPIMAFGTYLSDFILDAVAKTYDVNIPDTCGAIHRYAANNADIATANGKAQMLVSPDTAANIMCLPARISVYFRHATGAAWKWMLGGFGHSATQIVVGAICIVMFIKCIFKYAFMTLGIVADLFLTLLMLPFTALAESMPATEEKNYAGQIFSGFLAIFSTKKLSDVIAVFVNAVVYFVSLAIIIAICAALLSNIVDFNQNAQYATGRAMTTLLCGGLVLYLADKADKLAKQIGGSINNSFGESLMKDTKTLWGDTKNLAGKIYKDWTNKK